MTDRSARAAAFRATPASLASGEPLPPYTYVPGKSPHPLRDPAGHMYGHPVEPPEPIDETTWSRNRASLHGLELFNAGYYWEAHEVWEGLWHAHGREGVVAEFLKGLIKLAAAGVKAYEGREEGVRRHARKARGHFEAVERQLPGGTDYLGFRLGSLLALADRLESDAASLAAPVVTPAAAHLGTLFPQV